MRGFDREAPSARIASFLKQHRASALLAACALVAGATPGRAASCRFEPYPPPQVGAAAATSGDPFGKTGTSQSSEKSLFANFPPVTGPIAVRGATFDKPMLISASAAAPLWLNWGHFPAGGQPDLRQRLEIEIRSSSNGDYKPYCDTDWTKLTELPMFGRLPLDGNGAASWRIRVFERNLTPAISELEEDRSYLTLTGPLSGELVTSSPARPLFDTFAKSPPTRTPICDDTTVAPPTDAEPIASGLLPAGALDVPGAIYSPGGEHLYLKIDRSDPASPTHVEFAAKPIAYAVPPVPVCTLALGRSTGWMMVTAPWSAPRGLRWAVTFDHAPPSVSLSYSLLRDRTAAGQPQVPLHGVDVYSCTKSHKLDLRTSQILNPAPFRGAYALTITTGLHAMGVSAEVYDKVVESLLTSLANWRIACTRCSSYQFSIIEVDGTLYVPQGMLQGQPDNYRATFARAYPFDTRSYVDKNTGIMTPVLPYIRVSETPRQRSRFCVQKPEYGTDFDPAASPLCRPSPPSASQEMRVDIKWQKARGGCADDIAIVACWDGASLIKMNMADYSFYAGDVGQPLIGTSPRQVDLIRVFTHEVGHWLGLAHLGSANSVMSARFAGALCIDDATLDKLNSIASGEEDPAYGAEALRYE